MAERLDTSDLQGIVASAYPHLPWAAYLLLAIDPQRGADARRWLGAVSKSITPATNKRETGSLNIALTCTGLQRIGVEPAVINSFPQAFVEGMRSQRRRRILGDSEDALRWGDANAPVDVLLMAFAPLQPEAAESAARLIAEALQYGLTPVDTLEAHIFDDRREHFGFVDGISQPVIEGFAPTRSKPVHDRDVVANGEFVLGYENEYGYVAEAPLLGPQKNLGRNGTYLVFRETSQDVVRFTEFLDDAARRTSVPRPLLAAKVVGRWTSGAPLVKTPNLDDENPSNDFGFAEDPDGFRCPLGAHIRRANPRDGSQHGRAAAAQKRSGRHRLLRRGRSFGPRFDPAAPSLEKRGLHFIALCADIERQFEFVQQTWINNPALADLDEVDPLVGACDSGATFTLQGGPVRRRMTGLQNFVTLQGGAYFFMPSIAALQWLASMRPAD